METNDHFMSATIGQLAGALSAFQGKCPEISKECTVKVQTRSGGAYSFQYASLDNIISSVRPVLSENGLAITQLTSLDGSLTTILMHSSGEYIGSRIKIAGAKLRDSNPNSDGMSPQEYGSAITYMRRYAYTAILGLATEEDDDGNAASGNTAQKTTQPTKWLNQGTSEWKQAVEMLELGQSLADVKAMWKVNKECESLLAAIKPIANSKPSEQPAQAKAAKKEAAQPAAPAELPPLVTAMEYAKIYRLMDGANKSVELFGEGSPEHQEAEAEFNKAIQANKYFSAAVEKLKNKTTTIEKIEQKFSILPAAKEFLESL
jgi:hypothetical protein